MIPRGFFILLSGGGLAQVITLLSLPILGRLYDPTAFGQLAAVMAIVSLATVLVHGRYQMAIPVAETDVDAGDLLILASLCTIILSLPIVTMIYYIVGRLPDGLTLWVLLASATLITVLSSVIDILAYWRSRKGRFRVSAQNNVARTATTVVNQLILAFTNSVGLLIGTGLGTAVAASLAVIDLVRHDVRKMRFPSFARFCELAYQYRSYPLFGVPQGWLAAVSWNMMPLLLLRFGGTAIAGQYWIAYRLLVAPIALFNGTYRQATLPMLRDNDDESSKKLIVRHTLWIAGTSFFPLLIVFLLGEQLFSIAMGSAWKIGGLLAAWLSIGIFADLLKIPVLVWLQSRSLQARILAWEAAIIVLRYAGAGWYFMQGDSIAAVAVFSCLGFLGWLVFCLYELAPYKRLNQSGSGQ